MENRLNEEQEERDNKMQYKGRQNVRVDIQLKSYQNDYRYCQNDFVKKYKINEMKVMQNNFEDKFQNKQKIQKQEKQKLVVFIQQKENNNILKSFDKFQEQNRTNCGNKQLCLFRDGKLGENMLDDNVREEQVTITTNNLYEYEREEQISNRYTKCIQIANQYLSVLKKSYYACLIRLLFIVLIYYIVDFNVIKSIHTNNGVDENDKNLQQFGPWNVMIYFLSGSIDMISVIGYISAIRFLKKQIKVLRNKQKTEQDRMKAERKKKEVSVGQKMQEDNSNKNKRQVAMESLEQQPRIDQMSQRMFLEYRERTIRIGRQETYLSIYSIIRQYKYKNKDQSAAFKIAKIMHITATFLFFGRKALIEQDRFATIMQSRGNFFSYQLSKELLLWFFLITAYLGSFQIDLFQLEGSLGPFIKVNKFHISKINQVYCGFMKWRRKYGVFLKIGVVLVVVCIIIEIVMGGGKAILVFKVLLLISGVVSIRQNNEIIYKSQMYISQKNQIVVQESMSQKVKILAGMREENNLQKMVIYNNLSLLGILNHHSTKFQYLLMVVHRIVLVVYCMCILKQSEINYKDLYILCINGPIFFVFFVGEMWKFNTIMNFQLNLLSCCQYQDLVNLCTKQKSVSVCSQSSIISENGSNNQNKNINIKISHLYNKPKKEDNLRRSDECREISVSTFCSVCLSEYEATNNVIVICCGHLFHEKCLLDWLKQKKECPLCRLNIEDYYEEIRF